jgi:hypothetical protein
MAKTTKHLVPDTPSVPPVWDLLHAFQPHCTQHGWTPHNIGDLVHADGHYHKFFWIRGLYPSTFRNLITQPRCTLQDGASYRLVEPTYMAWVLPVTPPTMLWLYLLKDAPRFAQTVALYDLSPIYAGDSAGVKLNETSSHVFHAFEAFLRDRYGISFTALTGQRHAPLTRIIPPHAAEQLR